MQERVEVKERASKLDRCSIRLEKDINNDAK